MMMGKKIFVLAAMLLFALSAVTYAVSDTSEIVQERTDEGTKADVVLRVDKQLAANNSPGSSYLHLGVMRAAVTQR